MARVARRAGCAVTVAELKPLPRAFHERPVVELARALLGQLVVRELGDGRRVVARLVETEAYGGRAVDPSAHSFKGPTPRCEVMFGPAAHAYVYATQGRCCCLNVTAEGSRDGRAVLLRAAEIVEGVEHARAWRLARLKDGPTQRRVAGGAHDHELAAGPGRLCLCLDTDRGLNAVDLTRPGGLWLARGEGVPDDAVRWTPRVGLNPRSASFGWRWRVFDARSSAVSVGRGAGRAMRAPRPVVCPAAPVG